MARRTVGNYLAELPTEPESFVAIANIRLPESQPRRYFDPEKIQQLAASIQEYGILEPLLVRPVPHQGNHYELVAGERRYRAAMQLDLKTVPVVIRDLNDQQALAIALVENLTREDLNPVEEAEGILKLLEIELAVDRKEIKSLLYSLDNEKKGKVITHNVMGSPKGDQIEAVFTKLGQNWASFTANRLPLLNLPEDILEALQRGEIAYTKAKAIARLKDSEVRSQLLQTAIRDNLSLSEIRKRINELAVNTAEEKPQSWIDQTAKRLKATRLWEKNPEKWNEMQALLAQIDALIIEALQ
ncbi:chromosome partitioning protein, ParB family (plasmid) [[Synechococcus] sp. NIES-970]|nr:chromosome partitioning protein, ParB family [[Synechococcus] sp. NIES-970]